MNKDKTFNFAGSIFYYFDNKLLKIEISKDNFNQIITKLYKIEGDIFHRHLEGEFFGYVENGFNNYVDIFTDNFARHKVYYYLNHDGLLIGDDFWEIFRKMHPNEPKINRNALRCILLKGYIPSGYTFVKGLNRIRPGFSLRYNKKENKLKFFDHRTFVPFSNYKKKDLKTYRKLLEEAVLFRASKNNIVYISGGLDSAILLAILRKRFQNNHLSTASWLLLANGEPINKNELYRAKNLSDFYNVPLSVRSIDYSKENFIKSDEKAILEGQTDFFHLGSNFRNMFEKDDKIDHSIFIGQQSNSIHNFRLTGGHLYRFPYLVYLQNYPAKIWNYLWSPTFLRKIVKNNYIYDPFYLLLKCYMQLRGFRPLKINNEEKRVNKVFLQKYFNSFLFANNLAPFNKEKWPYRQILDKETKIKFEKWIFKNYFLKLISNYHINNHYSSLSHLDRDFHLQGSDSSIVYFPTRWTKSLIGMPYDDIILIKFIERMPENWGRSIELRRPRYPLHMVAKAIKLPNRLVEYSIYPEFSETTIYKTIFCGVTKDEMKDQFENIMKEKSSFKHFSLKERRFLKKLMKKFTKDEIDFHYFPFIHRVSFLFKLIHIFTIETENI